MFTRPLGSVTARSALPYAHVYNTFRMASTHHRRAQASVVPARTPFVDPQNSATAKPLFIKKLPTGKLMSYALLNLVTSSPLLLSVATNLMPYTPNFLVKRVVFPIYCGGETYAEVQETAKQLLDRGIGNMMLSYAVEDANGTAPPEAFDSSVKAICGSVENVFVPHNKMSSAMHASGAIQSPPVSGYIALKPTGLMKDSADILANYNDPTYAEKWSQYLDVCRGICQHAKDHGDGNVVIVFDAEKTWLQDGVYAAQRQMMKEFNRDGNIYVCGTIQMYLKRSVDRVVAEIELAKRDGYQVAMKLVRGAYLHSEPNRWEVIHDTKEDSDASFNQGADIMMDNISRQWKTGQSGPVGRLVVASHNVESCDRVDRRMAAEAPLGFDLVKDESVVFGQLMGMNEDQSQDLAARGRKVVKYVPWGPVDETKDYLKRRLEENGDAARGGWVHFVASVRELAGRMTGTARN